MNFRMPVCSIAWDTIVITIACSAIAIVIVIACCNVTVFILVI